MGNDVMQVVPVRMPRETVEQIDRMVELLGGSRSEFIRMGSEERLQRLAQAAALLSNEGAVERLGA